MSNELKDLIEYRVNRATETLLESKSMFASGFYNGSVNRTYYACYYIVSALLLKYEINTQTHKGVRQQFGHHFVKPGIVSKEMGRFFSDIFDRRQAGDYDDFIICDRKTSEFLLLKAEEFVAEIEKLVV